MPTARLPPTRQPWPLKWVALAIGLFIGIYTVLTLHYRKPGPAYRPYENMRERANVARLLEAGYQRTILSPVFPADPARPGANGAIADGAAGLPAKLRAALVDQPPLPSGYSRVAAPGSANALRPYSIQFTCTLPDNRTQLAVAQVYTRTGEIVIVPAFERLADGLLARSRDRVVQLVIPAGVLKPGNYRVTLAGARSSKEWRLQVN